jgi:Ca2+-binding EF-hand superfamily protein
MKSYVISAAATASLLTIAPALAQNSPAPMAMPAQHRQMQPMTRAQVVQKVQQHFAMVDTNRDGVVTKAEMDAAKLTMRTKMGDKRFDKLDANDDGSVSKGEFDAAHQGMQGHRMGMRGMHAGMGGRMFGMADSNKDGQVTLAEATAAAAAHFDRADANHDGTLTPDEMRAAHQAMRGKTGR